jgi:hypothetical protein
MRWIEMEWHEPERKHTPADIEIRAQRQISIKWPGPKNRYYRYARFHQARRARGPQLSPPE